MCEYQKFQGELPICDYTKQPCTLCVMGNKNTYEEAERSKQ